MGLLFIGMVMRSTNLKEKHLWKDLLILVFIRCMLLPIVMGVIVSALPISTESKAVFYLLTLMPAMTQLSVMGKRYNSDYHLASIWTTLSVLIGMAEIPLIFRVMEDIFHFL